MMAGYRTGLGHLSSERCGPSRIWENDLDNANQPATGTPFLVEECQLGDPGPKVWHDDTDSN